MISDQNRLIEGMGSFLGGANSAVDPALLTENQYAWGENIVVRDGFPTTRPGFKFIKLLPPGIIQGACYFYNKLRNTQELIGMINGRLYNFNVLDPDTAPKDISPASSTNPRITQKAYLVQANSFLVAQDGITSPIVYDGSTSYYSENITQLVDPTVSLDECTVTSNSTTVSVPSVTGLEAGMYVSSVAKALASNTTITAVNITASSVTLSKAATKTMVTSLNFYLPGVIRDDISIPVGTAMAFGNGRLWVAKNNNLFAGDLMGSSQNAEIKFSETIYFTGGGSFYFDDNVTGLAFLPGNDNSVGQGDLIVFTKNAIFAIKATNYNRTTWQSTPGMLRKIFSGRGSENQESIISTDKDIYFRSLEGIRSLVQTVGSGSVVSFSDSLEAARILAYDTERWLAYSPGVLFDSRYLLGASPKIQRITDANGNYTGKFNIVFSRLITKDFNAGAVTEAAPVYDGEWNGLQICKLVEGMFDGQRKCFALTCDSDGKNCLYEISLDQSFDLIKSSRNEEPVQKAINCSVETRRFSFGTPFDVKSLVRADIGFTEVYRDTTWTFEYAPDFLNKFYFVQTQTIENEQDTLRLTTQAPPDLPSGFKTIRTVKPSSIQVDLSKRLSNFGYMFQAKIKWEGHAKLALFRLHASRRDNSDLGEC